jgi:CheY-like chemotaxis protein
MTQVRILVVEDEAIIALGLQRRLQRLGYLVPTTASSGEEAIELAEQQQPDVIFMDIGLRGEIDGIEAAKQIRARFDIPIVFLTAYTDTDTRQRTETAIKAALGVK